MKFYTEEGNWDLVGNNTPVFFVRDPYKFPDFIHTQKRHPRTNLRSATAMWDFWSLSPESLHQVTILFSDRGLPQSPRFMNGYGSHTFSFINAENKRFWVKFHFKTMQGHRYWTNAEAAEVIGRTRESSQEDLFYAIERGEYPKWRMCVQIMTEEEAEQVPYNPFDLTKVWPHKDFPLIDVGILELNRNPDNYFAEIEQAAFSPSNVVPGISFSPDKMLQARIFSYADAHRYRLGTHYEALPVNRPRCPVHHYHKDGQMRFFPNNPNPDAYYEPNSFSGPVERPDVAELPLPITGDADRTITGKAMTTTASPEPCSTCSMKDSVSGCSTISPNRCKVYRNLSSNASWLTLIRSIRSTAQGCGERSKRWLKKSLSLHHKEGGSPGVGIYAVTSGQRNEFPGRLFLDLAFTGFQFGNLGGCCNGCKDDNQHQHDIKGEKDFRRRRCKLNQAAVGVKKPKRQLT